MSDRFDKLKETFDKFYPEYRSWVGKNRIDLPSHRIGDSALTVQEASDLLLEFAETIKIVLENKEQCFKYVSSGELNAICESLSGMMAAARNGVSSGSYTDFANRIDELIPYIRNVKFLLNINETEGFIQRFRLSIVDKIREGCQMRQAEYKKTEKSCQSKIAVFSILGLLNAFCLLNAFGFVSVLPEFVGNVGFVIVFFILTVLCFGATIVQSIKCYNNNSHKKKESYMVKCTDFYIAKKFKDMETYEEYEKKVSKEIREMYPESVKAKT